MSGGLTFDDVAASPDFLATIEELGGAALLDAFYAFLRLPAQVVATKAGRRLTGYELAWETHNRPTVMAATCCALRIELELELALVGYAVKSAKNVERALVAEPLRVLLEGVRVPAIARHGLDDVRDVLERTTCGNYELSLLRLFDLLLAYSPRRRFAAANLYLQAAYQVDLRNPWGQIAREIRRAVPYEMLERRACCWLERRYTERDEPLYGDETHWSPYDARRNYRMGNAP